MAGGRVSKFVQEGAAMYYELRKAGTSPPREAPRRLVP
jgi:hypothetical protein